MNPKDYLNEILTAPVYDVAIRTPLQGAKHLSARLGRELYLKREDMQPIFSFKLRGAYCKIKKLNASQRQAGVVCASAGNHGQGVAIVAQKLGIQAKVVMPVTTPKIKVDAVKALGGTVILKGNFVDEAFIYAQNLAEEEGATFVPPFDDPHIIAGQGTVGVEIMQQVDTPPDAIYVPVGGGGLIAGIAAYLHCQFPQVKVIGVEPEDAACLHAALEAGDRVTLPQVGLFADGVSVNRVGKYPWEILKTCVDEVVTVNVDEICAGIRDVFEETRSISEPAGALALAGMKKHLQQNSEIKRAVAIVSGANMNFDRLRYVAERALIGQHKEALFCVTMSEKAGNFLLFCKQLANYEITEFNYRYSGQKDAHIFVGIALKRGQAESDEILQRLHQCGYVAESLSDNDLAKTHVRYMVGGKSGETVHNERIFRFVFPERPKALLQFLTTMGGRWNISLFHYRNHGSSHGRVLAGLEIPDHEEAIFMEKLANLGYDYTEETQNTAYRFFLK